MNHAKAIDTINFFFGFFLRATPDTFNRVWGEHLGQHLWRKFRKNGDVKGLWAEMDTLSRNLLMVFLFEEGE